MSLLVGLEAEIVGVTSGIAFGAENTNSSGLAGTLAVILVGIGVLSNDDGATVGALKVLELMVSSSANLGVLENLLLFCACDGAVLIGPASAAGGEKSVCSGRRTGSSRVRGVDWKDWVDEVVHDCRAAFIELTEVVVEGAALKVGIADGIAAGVESAVPNCIGGRVGTGGIPRGDIDGAVVALDTPGRGRTMLGLG